MNVFYDRMCYFFSINAKRNANKRWKEVHLKLEIHLHKSFSVVKCLSSHLLLLRSLFFIFFLEQMIWLWCVLEMIGLSCRGWKKQLDLVVLHWQHFISDSAEGSAEGNFIPSIIYISLHHSWYQGILFKALNVAGALCSRREKKKLKLFFFFFKFPIQIEISR